MAEKEHMVKEKIVETPRAVNLEVRCVQKHTTEASDQTTTINHTRSNDRRVSEPRSSDAGLKAHSNKGERLHTLRSHQQREP